MREAHAHLDVEINCLLSGRLRYFAGGRFQELGPGDIAVFWAGMPHQSLEATPDAEGVWITLPLLWILRESRMAALSGRLMGGSFLAFPGSQIQHLLFARWEEDFREGSPARRELAAGEIENFLRRLSLESGSGPAQAGTPAGSLNRIEHVARFLSAHYREDLRVEDIARHAGLHPKYLLSFFRKACRMPLWEYVLMLRLAHAQRLLATTDRTVTDLALDAGFGSLNAFYHAFRKRVPGLTPAGYRKSLRAVF
jgi:AraC-like DNA-binding protein